MRKRFNIIAAILAVSLLSYSSIAGAFGGGDGSRYEQLQETAVFFNNSGVTLSAGDVVILDTTGTGVTSGTTLGGYITRTTSDSNALAVGVVKSRTSPDQSTVVVVTRGPVSAYCQNASGTNVTVGTAVGTYTVAGTCDSGTNLGVGIAGGDGFDDKTAQDGATVAGRTWIWVQGIGTE